MTHYSSGVLRRVENQLNEKGIYVTKKDFRNQSRLTLLLPNSKHTRLMTYVNLTPIEPDRPWIFTVGNLPLKNKQPVVDWYALVGYGMQTAVMLHRDEIVERFVRKGVEVPERATMTVHREMVETRSLQAWLSEITGDQKGPTMTEYTFRGFTISEHMLYSLKQYIEHKQPVGDFLTAVLENDLSEAVARADENNLKNLPAFVGYLYNEAPSQCWGSKKKVEEWLYDDGE